MSQVLQQTNPRAFKYLTVGTGAIPLVSTTLGANILGGFQPDADVAYQSVLVADSSMFCPGDFVNIIPAVGNTTPAAEQQVPVTAIADSTHITIANRLPHNSGDFVVLWWPCAQVTIQGKSGNSGSLFLGVSSSLTNAGVAAFIDLSLVLTYVTPTRPCDSDNLANYWIVAANSGQGYLPAAHQCQ